MDTDVMHAAPAPSDTDMAPSSEDLAAADLVAKDPATGDLTTGDLAAEDLIEEVSIDGMCGVY